MTKNKNGYVIREVCRALDLLELFSGNKDEFDVVEFTMRLKLAKWKVIQMLHTLENGCFIENNGEGRYRLGYKALSTGQACKKQISLAKQARPVLEEVVEQCNETTNVAILKDGHSIVYLDSVEAVHTVRVAPRVGLQLPSHCTAAGKIQLARMSPEELGRFLSAATLRRYTQKTITDEIILRGHLSKAAYLGYAIDNEELDSGVRCVSAPVSDYTGKTIGAISISCPTSRIDDKRMRMELLPLVTKAGAKLSARLGYVQDVAIEQPAVSRHQHLHHPGHDIEKDFPSLAKTSQLPETGIFTSAFQSVAKFDCCAQLIPANSHYLMYKSF